MGFFTRTRDIINSNINSALDKAENPEKMIKLMVREMEDTQVELKASLADKLSLKTKIEKDLIYSREKTDQWQKRAELAVAKNRDDLAREALQAKKQFENDMIYLEKESEHTDQIIAETRTNLTKLEEKLEEVLQKQRILIQRGVHAVEKKRVNNLVNRADASKSIIRFEQLEQRIERMEADAQVSGLKGASVESEILAMEKDQALEDELAKLKASVKKKAPKEAKPEAAAK